MNAAKNGKRERERIYTYSLCWLDKGARSQERGWQHAHVQRKSVKNTDNCNFWVRVKHWVQFAVSRCKQWTMIWWHGSLVLSGRNVNYPPTAMLDFEECVYMSVPIKRNKLLKTGRTPFRHRNTSSFPLRVHKRTLYSFSYISSKDVLILYDFSGKLFSYPLLHQHINLKLWPNAAAIKLQFSQTVKCSTKDMIVSHNCANSSHIYSLH